MSLCRVHSRDVRKVRKIKVRTDLVDVSDVLAQSDMPVFVTTKLVSCFQRHGHATGLEKLKAAVNRGIVMLKYNSYRKSNYIVDMVPKEFFTVERQIIQSAQSIIIDVEPLATVRRMVYGA